MAYPISNTALTDTFQGWLEKTNQLATIVSNFVLTAASNTIGATTTGNTNLVGIFSANTIAAGTELRGGTVDTPAALNVTSNAVFNGSQVSIAANTSIAGANLFVTSTKTTINSGTLNVSSNATFSNTVAFTNAISLSGNTTLSGPNTNITSTNTNITSNTTITAASVRILGGALTVASNTSITAENVSVTGTSLYVTSNTDLNAANTTIRGGTVAITSTVVANVIPSSNALYFGNTINRWSMFANVIDASVLTASNTTLNGSFANVNSLAFFRANTSIIGGTLSVTANTDLNAANVTIRGGTLNVSSMATFNSNTTINGNTLSITANATFTKRVVIQGDLQVTGNLTYSQTSYADVIPSAPGYSLGNTSFRWALISTSGDFSSNVTIAGTTLLNGAFTVNTATTNMTGNNIVLVSGASGAPSTNVRITVNRGTSANSFIQWNETTDTFQISNGNTAANVVLDNDTLVGISTTGNANTANTALIANNATNFNGQSASYYANATNITTGSISNTLLSGTYGITITGSANNATNLNGQSASYYLAWSNFSGKPTTLTGYGITDAVANSGAQTISGLKTFSDIAVTANLSFGSTTRQMLNLYGSTYAIGAQNLLVYVRTQKGFAVYQGGVHSDTENDAGSGGTSILLASNSAFTYKSNNVWHAGNYTPVVKVANTSPNANGDVVLSTIFQAKSANLDVFTVRSIGAASANDVIDRAAGDVRYSRIGNDNTLTGINTFTSSPIIPTPSANDASTKAATTAWALGKGGGTLTGLVEFLTYKETPVNLTIASNILTANVASGSLFNTSLNSNITSIVFQNIPATGVVSWIMKFNITGTFSIVWPTEVHHVGGSAPAISTTSGDVATFVLYTIDGGTTIQAYYSGSTR